MTAISLSIPSCFYLVQSGTVFWEALSPAVHWNTKTLSICAESTKLLQRIAIEVLDASTTIRSWLRFHIDRFPAPMGEMQRRRLEKALSTAPPGFSEPLLCSTLTGRSTICSLERSNELDVEYLNSYRDTMLIGAGNTKVEPAELCGILPKSADLALDTEMVRFLLDQLPRSIVVRFLDMETHSAMQMIGEAFEIGRLSAYLDTVGVARMGDVRSVAARINSW